MWRRGLVKPMYVNDLIPTLIGGLYRSLTPHRSRPLTPKGFWLCFTKIATKLPFLVQVPNFWKKTLLDSCEMKLPGFLQGQKMEICHLKCSYLPIYVVEISEFFFHIFSNKCTTRSYGYKITLVWKNVQNDCYSLDSLFKASWLHAWKFSDHLELYNT